VKKALVIHPFLFAIFPVLFLFAHNIHIFHVSQILGPVATTACLALLPWSVLSVVLRDKKRAGLVVSLFFLLFFSYSICYVQIRAFMVGVPRLSTIVTREHVLVAWIVLFSLGTYCFIKTRISLHNLTNIANIVAGSLAVISLANIAAYEFRMRSAWEGGGTLGRVEANPAGLEEPGVLPDIYYIILDGYARADILEEIYLYDNAEFLDYLTRKGFYVARESRSNYCQTLLSLASSLNMTYLDDLAQRIGIEYRGPRPMTGMIRNNAVIRFLKQYGYDIVVFPSGSSRTEIGNVDIYMASRWSLDEFQTMLISMTPIPFVANQLGVYDEYGFHRERILYTFDHLPRMAELEGPIFVFAHIIAPHPPFVFGVQGEEIDPEYPFVRFDGGDLIPTGRLTRDEYVDGYRGQLVFINERVKRAVDGILSNSTMPPIIILQADHGPASMLDWEDPDNTYFKERLAILNAYYLPNDGDMNLYDEVTPVNTFRVIFDHYFGADYELLEDESYFSTTTRPYAFTNVTGPTNVNMTTP
jgi:hypothetical protein